MRAILAALAVVCLTAAGVASARGNWWAAAAFSSAFWGWCWTFIAYTSAAAKVDRAVSEDDE
jgi:hypothetical protein